MFIFSETPYRIQRNRAVRLSSPSDRDGPSRARHASAAHSERRAARLVHRPFGPLSVRSEVTANVSGRQRRRIVLRSGIYSRRRRRRIAAPTLVETDVRSAGAGPLARPPVGFGTSFWGEKRTHPNRGRAHEFSLTGRTRARRVLIKIRRRDNIYVITLQERHTCSVHVANRPSRIGRRRRRHKRPNSYSCVKYVTPAGGESGRKGFSVSVPRGLCASQTRLASDSRNSCATRAHTSRSSVP